MNSIDKLAELFQKFPGIGKRQARRFVYFLLHKDNGYIQQLVNEIVNVKKDINQCHECYRFYPRDAQSVCPICTNNTETKQLMIVEKDADLENIHKTKLYEGKYFVLGGFIASHEKKRSYARTEQLLARIKRDRESKIINEVIFGLSISPEAEHTRLRLYSMIHDQYPDLVFTTLGRGLSSGTELEYSDTETLKYALESRIAQN
ncbi:MAG: toprim domain-containing protein [Candidatus Pacebacteria bacterium]|nr:toprim domain-containing protein [Candidatus Paceibacterota bacterium]